MNKEKIIILIYMLLTNVGYSFILYAIKNFEYPDVFYSYAITTLYVSSLLASLLYGNIEINERNYVFFNFLGIFSTLISIFFLVYPKNFTYILLSIIFSYFIGSSTSYAMIRVKKDVGLYYYFTLYGLFGFVLAQILIFIKMDFQYLILLTFFSFFLVTILLFSFYFKKFLDFIISSIKEEYGILGTIERVMSYVEKNGEGVSFKLIGKPSILSLLNFIVLIIFSVFWTSLVTKSSTFNVYYPVFMFSNSLFTAISYKYLKKKPDVHKSLIGLYIRMFSIGVLLFMLINDLNNVYLYLFLYILASISWAIFSFYMDDYVLNVKNSEYGYVIFFRNIASIIGASLVSIIGIYYSLIITFPLFFFSLIIVLIGFKKNI